MISNEVRGAAASCGQIKGQRHTANAGHSRPLKRPAVNEMSLTSVDIQGFWFDGRAIPNRQIHFFLIQFNGLLNRPIQSTDYL